MSYKLNEQRITPGGLDLLVPADQNPRRAALTDLVNVPQGECLDLTDWFAGCDGRLEQAPEPVRLSSLSAAGQNTLLQVSSASGNRIYYSDGSNLRQIGRAGEAAIATGFDGYPLGVLSYMGFGWFMNRGNQVRDDGSTTSAWTIAATSNAPVLTDLGSSGAPGINGGTGVKVFPIEDCYFVTWVVPLLGETNPTPSNRLTPAADGLGHSTQITQPAGAPSAATGWNIYRQVPGYGGTSLDGNTTPYLLNPAPIPISQTTYVDTGNSVDDQDDTSLLLDGVIMQDANDPPPAARVMANQTYNGRIVVANSAAHPNRMWYTNPLQPAFFPGSSDTYDGNWVDVGTDSGDAILAITVRPGFLTIYRQKSIWIHLGDCGLPSAVLEVAIPEMGIVGPRAVVSTGAADFFIWNDGVYGFNNDAVAKSSFKVDHIWRGLATENFPVFQTTSAASSAIGHRDGRLFVSYFSTSSTWQGLVLHIPSGRWFAVSTGFAAYLDTGPGGLLGAGAGVFGLEWSWGSDATSLAFQSQYHDSGLPDRMKTWADLVISHNTAGATLSIICRQNKDGGVYGSSPPAADSFTLATFSSTTITKQIFPLLYPSSYTVVALRGLPIKCFSLSIRITGSGAVGAPAVIESPILLHYYVEARQGLTFDTALTNHGLEGVGVIDQIEIDCDSTPGPATLIVWSDIPGGVPAIRTGSGIAIPQSSGRQVLRFVLGTPIFGRIFRHQVESTTGFQIYGYKVRVLPIGVYADGSQGDFWYTEALAPGEQGGAQR